MQSEQWQRTLFPDSADLGEGFKAVRLHLTALRVHPGRKRDSRQAQSDLAEDRAALAVPMGQGGWSSAEVTRADGVWLEGR